MDDLISKYIDGELNLEEDQILRDLIASNEQFKQKFDSGIDIHLAIQSLHSDKKMTEKEVDNVEDLLMMHVINSNTKKLQQLNSSNLKIAAFKDGEIVFADPSKPIFRLNYNYISKIAVAASFLLLFAVSDVNEFFVKTILTNKNILATTSLQLDKKLDELKANIGNTTVSTNEITNNAYHSANNNDQQSNNTSDLTNNENNQANLDSGIPLNTNNSENNISSSIDIITNENNISSTNTNSIENETKQVENSNLNEKSSQIKLDIKNNSTSNNQSNLQQLNFNSNNSQSSFGNLAGQTINPDIENAFIHTIEIGPDSKKFRIESNSSSSIVTQGFSDKTDISVTNYVQSISYYETNTLGIGIELGYTTMKFTEDIFVYVPIDMMNQFPTSRANKIEVLDPISGKETIRTVISARVSKNVVWAGMFAEQQLLDIAGINLNAKVGIGISSLGLLGNTKLNASYNIYENLFIRAGVESQFYSSDIISSNNKNFLNMAVLYSYGIQFKF